jgi:hypothetical protein
MTANFEAAQIFVLIAYNNQGKILGCQGGSKESLDQEIEDAEKEGFEGNFLFAETEATDLDSYVNVESLKVNAKGEKPSDGYIFNYEQGVWDFTLAPAKEAKWEEIKQQRDGQEFGSFEWQGNQIQCDEVSQRRLQGAVQMAAISPSIVIDWTMEDNSVVSLTALQVMDMGTALGAHVTATHERGRMLRQLINDATTEIQLDLITW